MEANDIIVAGITGTAAFTLFSYMASKVFDEKFEEPELLGKMIDRVTPAMEKEQAKFTGWLVHYLVGIGFAEAYKQLIHITDIKPSVCNGILTGAITGLPASLIWDTAFKNHPAPPRKRSFSYCLQLITGHAIFGAVIFGILNYSYKKDEFNIYMLNIIKHGKESKFNNT